MKKTTGMAGKENSGQREVGGGDRGKVWEGKEPGNQNSRFEKMMIGMWSMGTGKQ